VALISCAVVVQGMPIECPTVNLDPIVVKGNHFFNSVTGEYFPVKGIAYYPRPNTGNLSIANSVDFFTDEYMDLWQADIENFKALHVNTIRIYAVDPSKSHINFMCALQEAGIYVMVELLADCKGCGVGPDEAPSCYPASLKERGQFIINEFSKYSNTLTFSAGNEVTLYARNRTIELNAPCQKKFLRDMKAYVNKCSENPLSILPRKVPIGMVNWDEERTLQTRYFNCQTDPNDDFETPDWYGLNAYVDCEVSALYVSELIGMQQLRSDFAYYDLSVPVVITEYGCRERFPTIGQFEAQRTWLQVEAIYSSDFTNQFSGGVVFEYSAEKVVVDDSDQGNPWPYYEFMKLNYGVGYYGPMNCDHRTISCGYFPYPEFDLLSAKLEAVDTSFMPNMDSFTPTGGTPACPTGLAPLTDFDWPTDDDEGLPCYLIPTESPTAEPTVQPPQDSSVPSKSPAKTPTADAPSTFGGIDADTLLDMTPSPTVQPTTTAKPSSLPLDDSSGPSTVVAPTVFFLLTVLQGLGIALFL